MNYLNKNSAFGSRLITLERELLRKVEETKGSLGLNLRISQLLRLGLEAEKLGNLRSLNQVRKDEM